MAQDDDRSSRRSILVGGEGASPGRLHSQDGKEAGRNAPRPDALRLFHIGQIDAYLYRRGHIVEDTIPLPPIEEVCRRDMGVNGGAIPEVPLLP